MRFLRCGIVGLFPQEALGFAKILKGAKARDEGNEEREGSGGGAVGMDVNGTVGS